LEIIHLQSPLSPNLANATKKKRKRW